MDARLIRRVTGRGADGFSLIELMVVVAVLSVLSITAGLSVSRFTTAPQSDRRWFQALDQGLRDDALMTRQTQGMIVSDRGVRRLATAGNGPAGEIADRLWNVPPDWILPIGPARLISYLPDGRSTPFIVEFRDGTSIIRCTSDGWTGLTCGPR